MDTDNTDEWGFLMLSIQTRIDSCCLCIFSSREYLRRIYASMSIAIAEINNNISADSAGSVLNF